MRGVFREGEFCLEGNEKRQSEYFCSYSSRLTNFLKAFGLSYESRGVNEVTGAPYCVFKRTPKLNAVVKFWSDDCRNLFKEYDDEGKPGEAGDA